MTQQNNQAESNFQWYPTDQLISTQAGLIYPLEIFDQQKVEPRHVYVYELQDGEVIKSTEPDLSVFRLIGGYGFLKSRYYCYLVSMMYHLQQQDPTGIYIQLPSIFTSQVPQIQQNLCAQYNHYWPDQPLEYIPYNLQGDWYLLDVTQIQIKLGPMLYANELPREVRFGDRNQMLQFISLFALVQDDNSKRGIQINYSKKEYQLHVKQIVNRLRVPQFVMDTSLYLSSQQYRYLLALQYEGKPDIKVEYATKAKLIDELEYTCAYIPAETVYGYSNYEQRSDYDGWNKQTFTIPDDVRQAVSTW